MKANDAVEFEECIETPHGERVFLSVRFPLHDADGVVYAVCTQSTDITARKEAENQLRLTARVFDHSGEGIVITNRKGMIMTGTRPREVRLFRARSHWQDDQQLSSVGMAPVHRVWQQIENKDGGRAKSGTSARTAKLSRVAPSTRQG